MSPKTKSVASSRAPTSWWTTATQQRLDPRQQLRHLERLDQVVVGAQLEADDLVDDLAPRGQHQDRRLHALLAKRAADVEAVAAREHHVEQDHVEGAGARGLERRARIVALSTS